jgi:hypothetical protein
MGIGSIALAVRGQFIFTSAGGMGVGVGTGVGVQVGRGVRVGFTVGVSVFTISGVCRVAIVGVQAPRMHSKSKAVRR